MSARYQASCDCGWHGTYPTDGQARLALGRHSCERQHRLRADAHAALEREKAIDRTPKACLHPVAAHQHGTYAAYTLDACRCLPCTAARSAYDAARARRRAYERPTMVPAQPVRTHVYALKAAGLGKRTIAQLSGVSATALDKLLRGYGRDGAWKPPSRRMTKAVADALLAVPLPALGDYASGARVDATGTRRRLQALTALGWSVKRLCGEHDLDRQALDHALGGAQLTTARTAQTVAAAYQRIGDRPPTMRSPADAGAVTRAKNKAALSGWTPPAMWDPEVLDDPEAPEPTTAVVDLRGPVDLEEFCHLVRGGEHPERAAARLGVRVTSVATAARRHGHKATLAFLARQEAS